MDPTQNNDGGNAPADNNVSDAAKEWDQAGLDFLSDRGIEPEKGNEKEQGTIDEQAKSKEGDEGEGAPKGDPEAKKSDEKPGASDDSGAQGADNQGKPAEGDNKVPEAEKAPEPTPAQTERTRRQELLELEADRKEIAVDVKEKMFSDVPTRLEDADGDPIETVADVMRLQNPRTGKPFTAEEASQWLMLAQRNVEKQQAEVEQKVEKIVETNLNLKEQAERVKSKYGELLKHMPNLRAQVWQQYQATLQKDEKSEIITGAPVDMEGFYDTIMAPYMKQVERLKADAEAEEKRKQEAEQRKKETEEKKKQSQNDRGDVFSTRTKIEDISDPEEKEWAQAAKDYYEG
jgi:hypothetical protein